MRVIHHIIVSYYWDNGTYTAHTAWCGVFHMLYLIVDSFTKRQQPLMYQRQWYRWRCTGDGDGSAIFLQHHHHKSNLNLFTVSRYTLNKYLYLIKFVHACRFAHRRPKIINIFTLDFSPPLPPSRSFGTLPIADNTHYVCGRTKGMRAKTGRGKRIRLQITGALCECECALPTTYGMMKNELKHNWDYFYSNLYTWKRYGSKELARTVSA